MINAGKAAYKGPKATPVLLLLDTSGSMNDDHGEKINTLNKAVTGMIDLLKKDAESFYVMGIITFGGDKAEKYLPFTALDNRAWKPLTAGGGTPLADAFRVAKDMIEAKEDKAVTGRSYGATVVLVSDGRPNLEKRLDTLLASFIGEGRSQKCDRWAMGIGSNLDEQMLRRFVKPKQKPEDPDKFVRGAASDIIKFFEKVSISVSYYAKESGPGLKLQGGGHGGGSTVQSGADDDEQI
jgi:uncharacterized protein YegL